MSNETAKTEYAEALKLARRCKDGTINGNDAHRAYVKFRKVLTDGEMAEVQTFYWNRLAPTRCPNWLLHR